MKIIEERQEPTLSVVLKSVAFVGENTDWNATSFPLGVFLNPLNPKINIEILHTSLHKSGEFVCGYWAFKISPLLGPVYMELGHPR